MKQRSKACGRPLGVAVVATIALCGPAGLSCGGDSSAEADPNVAKDEDAQAEWPEGTVLAVNELPIRAADVDGIADAISGLYPHYVPAQCRRLALTNVVLPLWAVRTRDAKERDASLERCRTARIAATRPEATATPDEETLAGGVRALGLDLWVPARELEPGEWSEPIDLIGRWALVRLDRITPGEQGQGEWLEVTLRTFPYLDFSYPDAVVASTSIDHAIDHAELEIVSPEWGEFVPEEFKYRMRPHDPPGKQQP